MADIPCAIGRYEIISRLGQGGMGSLYLAKDPRAPRRHQAGARAVSRDPDSCAKPTRKLLYRADGSFDRSKTLTNPSRKPDL